MPKQNDWFASEAEPINTNELEQHQNPPDERLEYRWHHGDLAVDEITHLANSLFELIVPRSVANGHWGGGSIPQIKLRCLLSQVYDYLGQTEKAQLCVRDGEAIFSELHRESNTSRRTEKSLLHSKIRLCLEYAHSYYYRAHRYDEARRCIELCKALLESMLPSELPALALASYYLARTFRRIGDYEQAEERFRYAIETYNRYATEQTRTADQLPISEIKRRLDFAEYKAGLCSALGLGWLNVTRGQMTSAYYNVQCARIDLTKRHDVINQSYVCLIGAAIERATSENHEKLKQVAAELHRIRALFQSCEHVIGRTRAEQELAKTYFNLGEYDKAKELINNVLKSRDTDTRWKSRACTLLSRIQQKRNELESALRFANKGERLAIEVGDLRARIDARLAAAEVNLAKRRFLEARDLVLQTTKMAEEPIAGRQHVPDAKLRAVFSLYLARTYVETQDILSAKTQLQIWEQLKGVVEHAGLHSHATKVREQIENCSRDFLIQAPAGEQIRLGKLKYRDQDRLLKQWLITRVFEVTREVGEASQLLGISRDALYQWLKTYDWYEKYGIRRRDS